MIFVKLQNPFIAHFSKLFRKRAAVQIQIIRQLLAVEWNLKVWAMPFGCLGRQVDQEAAANCFRSCA